MSEIETMCPRQTTSEQPKLHSSRYSFKPNFKILVESGSYVLQQIQKILMHSTHLPKILTYFSKRVMDKVSMGKDSKEISMRYVCSRVKAEVAKESSSIGRTFTDVFIKSELLKNKSTSQLPSIKKKDQSLRLMQVFKLSNPKGHIFLSPKFVTCWTI